MLAVKWHEISSISGDHICMTLLDSPLITAFCIMAMKASYTCKINTMRAVHQVNYLSFIACVCSGILMVCIRINIDGKSVHYMKSPIQLKSIQALENKKKNTRISHLLPCSICRNAALCSIRKSLQTAFAVQARAMLVLSIHMVLSCRSTFRHTNREVKEISKCPYWVSLVCNYWCG